MSTKRRLENRSGPAVIRLPNGVTLCRFCRKPIPQGRRTFCSEACVHQWKIRSDVSYMRKAVFLRDKGICKVCGFDTIKLQAALYELHRVDQVAWELKLEELQIPKNRRSPGDSLWDADHILEVADGGGESPLSNIQTLCLTHHKLKSAMNAALRRNR